MPKQKSYLTRMYCNKKLSRISFQGWGSHRKVEDEEKKKTALRKQMFISSVQLLSCVQLFATPWTGARQASLSITNPPSLRKLTCIELMMSSNHLILCHPLLLLPSIFPSIRVFTNESALCIRWPKFVSASTSVLPVNTQDWFPLGWTGWISLQSKGLSRVFSNTTVQKHQFFVLSFLYSPSLTSIRDYWKNHSFD